MEFNKSVLSMIIDTFPGDLAVYRLENGRLIDLYTTRSLAAFCGMTWEEFSELTASDAADAVLDSDRHYVADVLKDVLEKNQKEIELTYRLKHKIKISNWIHAKARVIGTMSGCPVLMVNFLYTSSETLERDLLLDNAISNIYVIDKKSQELLYVNEPAIEMWGEGNSYIGDTCYHFINGYDAKCQSCPLDKMENGRVCIDECYLEKYDIWLRIDCRDMDWFGREAAAVFSIDISDQKKKNIDIENSRMMYEAATELADLSVWNYDIKNHRIVLSDNRETASDRSKYRIPKIIEDVPESTRKWIRDEDYHKCVEMYDKLENGEPTVWCEYWYKTQEGQEPRCEHVIYKTVFDKEGKPVSALGVGQDITAQKLKKEKYDNTYAQLANMDPHSLGTIRVNLTKNLCMDGESRLNALKGFRNTDSAEAFFEQTLSLISDESIRDECRKEIDRSRLIKAFMNGEAETIKEFPVSPKKNIFKWVRASLHMMQNPYTSDIEAIAYMQDITDEKKNRELIRHVTENKSEYIGLLNINDNSIDFRIVRPGLKFVEADDLADYDKYRESICDSFILPGERSDYMWNSRLDAVMSYLKTHDEYTFIYQRIEDEVPTRQEVQYSWFNKEQGEILMIRKDITASYKQEQERLKRMEAALRAEEAANRSKTEFVSRISHDIRTPISIISSMTDFAFSDIDDREKLRNDLEKIRSSNTFLLSLINDVLDISKIDSGSIDLLPEPYDYTEFISNIRNMFGPLCSQKGLELIIEDPQTKAMIYADKIRFNQILLNLMSNAVKFTPSGGTVRLSCRSKNNGDGTVSCGYTVVDSGIGMSREFQETMFEPFSQERSSANSAAAETGTGLGLSIVKRLVDLMGGSINVESERGKGTAISVDFIVSAVDDEHVSLKNGMGRSQAGAERKKKLTGRVLLAEDNPMNTEIAVRILESFGLKIDAVSNGREAAELFMRSAPHTYKAVLMDIQMPVMNGYEATERIRLSDHPDAKEIPIIAMTADAFVEAVEKSIAAGMNEHITKPIDPGLLYSRLSEIIK